MDAGIARGQGRGSNGGDWEATIKDAIDRSGYVPLDAQSVPAGVAAEGFGDALRDVWLGTLDPDGAHPGQDASGAADRDSRALTASE